MQRHLSSVWPAAYTDLWPAAIEWESWGVEIHYAVFDFVTQLSKGNIWHMDMTGIRMHSVCSSIYDHFCAFLVTLQMYYDVLATQGTTALVLSEIIFLGADDGLFFWIFRRLVSSGIHMKYITVQPLVEKNIAFASHSWHSAGPSVLLSDWAQLGARICQHVTTIWWSCFHNKLCQATEMPLLCHCQHFCGSAAINIETCVSFSHVLAWTSHRHRQAHFIEIFQQLRQPQDQVQACRSRSIPLVWQKTCSLLGTICCTYASM